MQNRPSKIYHFNHLLQRHRRRMLAVIITIIVLLGLLTVSIIFFPNRQYNKELPFLGNKVIPLASQSSTVKLPVPKKAVLSENLQEVTVKQGDSLSTIFERLHIPPQQLLKIAKLSLVKKAIKRLQSGQLLRIVLGDNHQLLRLTMPLNSSEDLVVERTEQGFIAKKKTYQFNVSDKLGQAVITSSFYQAGEKAGIPRRILMNLAKIYAWTIDFKRSIRKGDHFAVLYQLVENVKTGSTESGDILAAVFIHKGKTYYAIRYRDQYGRVGYYNENGKSLRKAFQRKPVSVGYISSGFNLHRHHPILGILRPHTGTDFAAPYGTPIHATGDGRIIYRSRKGGYGRCIVINHGNGITTLYAHMSRYAKKLKLGSYVKKGQVIGYVGSSGLSTGPHVHYEFRINHHYKNPVTVKLPNAKSISVSEQKAFKKYVKKEKQKLSMTEGIR